MNNRGANLDSTTLEPMSGQEFQDWLLSEDISLHGKLISDEVSILCGELYKKRLNTCCFEHKLDICAEGVYYLIFENCVFKSIAEIQINTLGQTIKFDHCTGVGLELTSCSTGELLITGCDFSATLNFRELINIHELHISTSDVHGHIRIGINEPHPKLAPEIEDVNCDGDFSLTGEYALPILYIRSGKFNRMSFDNLVQKLFIGTKNERLQVKYLDFTSYSFPAEITVDNVEVNELMMSHVFGKETYFEFIDTTVKHRWEMTYATPAKLNTFNFNLTGCKVYLDGSLLTNCVFSSTNWPTGKRLQSTYEDKAKSLGSLRESYRQLKQAMLKDSNNIDALAFYRNEMDSYRAYAKNNPDVKWEDKFILCISWLFSDHGQSIIRPIVGLFALHFVLFSILVFSGYNDFIFSFSNASCEAFRHQAGHFFMLLNPAHSTPTDAKNFSDGMLAIDFLMRLSSGFFIYHIIRASRKFAKL